MTLSESQKFELASYRTVMIYGKDVSLHIEELKGLAAESEICMNLIVKTNLDYASVSLLEPDPKEQGQNSFKADFKDWFLGWRTKNEGIYEYVYLLTRWSGRNNNSGVLLQLPRDLFDRLDRDLRISRYMGNYGYFEVNNSRSTENDTDKTKTKQDS